MFLTLTQPTPFSAQTTILPPFFRKLFSTKSPQIPTLRPLLPHSRPFRVTLNAQKLILRIFNKLPTPPTGSLLFSYYNVYGFLQTTQNPKGNKR